MAPGLDPSPNHIFADHRQFMAALARAAALPDQTGLAAGQLLATLRRHITREEGASLALASVHFALPQSLESPQGAEGEARVAAALAEFPQLRREHEALRGLAARLRQVAAREGHPETAALCRRILGHITLEDGIAHPLAALEARAFLASRRGPPARPPA